MPIHVVKYTSGITVNSPVYLDSNFLISCLITTRSKCIAAKLLLSELLDQLVEIYISTLVIDEVWWGLLG